MRGKRLADPFGDRTVVDERFAEVEPDDAAEPARELLRQRPIEPVEPAHLLGGPAADPAHRIGPARSGRAGGQMQQQEDDHRDPEEGRNREEQPPRHVPDHGDAAAVSGAAHQPSGPGQIPKRPSGEVANPWMRRRKANFCVAFTTKIAGASSRNIR